MYLVLELVANVTYHKGIVGFGMATVHTNINTLHITTCF